MRKILNLYDATVRGEATDRVCSLPDLSSATVRREINGEYSLTAIMPERGSFADMVQIGRAIKCTVNEAGKEQFFIIKRRSRALSGDLRIYAEHQSYYYNGVIVRGSAAGARTPSMAFNQIWIAAHPSVSDIGTATFSRTGNTQVTSAAVTKPTSLRGLQLGWLIDNFGGELIYDGFNVEWVDSMGADNGVVYRYGANITEMESEDILDSYASGIFPYWGSIDPKSNIGIVTISGYTLNYPGTWPVEVIKPVDLTSSFDQAPSAADLLTAAQEWMAANAPTGTPVSIKASRARSVGDTPVDLGDTVTVVNTPWGISQKTRIFSLTFDALRGRVTDVQFGTISPSFAGAVKNMK